MNYDSNGLSASDIALLQGRNNSGFGGENGAWWIVLFLIFAMGGWGNGFGGSNGGYGAVPYLLNNTNNDVQRGFDQSAVINGLTNIGTSITNGFSNQAVSQCNQTTELLSAINNDRFDTVSAITNSTNALNNTMMVNEMARQQCCCDTKQAIADLKYTIATENCADRQALSDGVRDIIANQTASVQTILDKLCQQEIDAKNETISNLRTQLNMQNLASSQASQTAQLIADNNAQTSNLINRIAPYPQPAYLVGNPYAYNGYNYNNCGCGNY